MKNIFTIMLCLLFYGTAQAQGSFATADTMSAGILKSGTVSSTVGQHYYKTWLPANKGVMRLITATSNTGGAFGIVQYRVYWKDQNTINYNNVSRNASTSGADTFIIGAIQADSLYILVDNVWAGQTQNYTVKYDIVNGTPNNETSLSNDTRATAEVLAINTTRDGYSGFSTMAGADATDWYKIVFPRNGTFKLYVAGRCMVPTGSTNLMPRLYFYDRNGSGTITAFFNNSTGFTWAHPGKNTYVQGYQVIADTFNVYGRAADTMYINLDAFGTAWPATYSLRWIVTDTAANNEPGPNETQATASPLAEGQTINGDISYVGNGPDVDDYYRIILRKDATLTLYASAQNTWNQQANPSPIFMVHDKNGTLLLNQNNAGAQAGQLRVANAFSVPFMGTVRDTMHVFGRAKDTFYVHVQNYHSGQGWAHAAHYTLRYQLDDTTDYNEAGLNETIATAQPITTADTVKGHVTYIDGKGNTDIDDYYRIVKPAGGSIILYITGRNTWGYNSASPAPAVRVKDKFGNLFTIKSATGAASGMMRVRNNGSLAYGQTVTDTMLITCIGNDTIYVHIDNYFNFQYGGWSGTYKFRYEYVPGPKSDFIYSRMGNEFGFVNQSKYADSYLWLMGNGQQYASRYPPMTTYVPGNYDVKLVAYNGGCNNRDTSKVNFTIAGVEYYTPKKAGRGGDVIMEIFGGNLSMATKVKLIKGVTTIVPRDMYPNGRLNHLSADFDLHFADTGIYDVVIEVPGQPPITYAKGFHIEGFQYPFAWSQVTGPSRMRPGIDNRYTLLVGNRGNVTANGVVVAMVWPKNVQLTWKARFHTPDYTKNDTVIAGNGKTYVQPNTIFKYIYDSLNTTIAIDSFEGQPYDGYIRFIQVQHVPPGSTVEIPFIANAAAPANTRFITYTHRPNMLGSCATGNYEDYGNALSSELLDALDMVADKSKVPLFVAFTKTAKVGSHHMQSAATYAGKEFWAWWDGYEIDHDAAVADWIRETDANNEYAIQTATAEVGGYLLNSAVGKAASANQQLQFGNKLLANSRNMSPATLEATQKIMGNLGKSVSGINYDRLKLLTNLLKESKNLYDLNEKLKTLEQLAIDCPELQAQIDELKKLLNQELDHQDPSLTNVDTRTSFDPNGIYGPSGIDTQRYIADVKRQPFVVHFENVDTAGADAQDVIIRDTIDKTRFDVSSVTLGDIVIANELYRVPKGRSEFTFQRRLANRPGMSVRVTGKTDMITGIITWTFSSLDSASGNRPLLDGFLKPNINKPEGEASISYEVNPLSTLTDGMTLSSQASIVFDQNAAILTDLWSNKLDIAPPTSQVTSATLVHDSTFVLRFSGSDVSSGVSKYYVYVSTNGGAWNPIGATAADSMVLLGQPDSSYSFYSLAIDRVENKEQKAPVAEASITVPPTGVTITRSLGTAFSIFPNPADRQVNIEVFTNRPEDVKIDLYTIMGQKVATLYQGKVHGNYIVNSDLQQFSAGVYTIQLTTSNGNKQTAKLVIAR